MELLPRVVNAFIGSMTAVLVALAAWNLFGQKSAVWRAGLVAALFPSMLLWSTLNLKEVWAIFAVVLITYEVTRLRSAPLSHVVPGLALALVIFAVARPWLLIVCAVSLTAGFLWSIGHGRIRALALVGVLAGGLLLLYNFGVGQSEVEILQRDGIQDIRESTTTGGSALEQPVELSAPGAALRSVPRALATVTFGPFPWESSGLRQVVALPEVLIWYTLVPAVFIGFRRAWRTRKAEARQLLATAGGIMLAIAILEGNLGLAYRHRLQALAIFFVFAGGGLVRRRRIERQGTLS
jgi:hypothetical protein